MRACFGDEKKVNDIDAQAIEKAIGKLRLSKEQGGRGLSIRTVNKVLTTMSRIFKFGIRNKCGIQTDPVKLIEKVKENSGEQTEAGERLNILHEVTEREVLTPEEAKRVILAAKPGFYRIIIMLAIYTGARISEILALLWSYVHLDRGTIEIRRTVSTAKVKGEIAQEKHRWFDPKTKRGIREIPIPPQLVVALKEWKEKCPKSRLDLVFCNEFGEPYDRTGIGRYGLKPALKQAGIEKAVTMHGLRHTYASMLILLGRKIPEVSRYLGHADVSITMRVYAHFLKPKKQDTMSDLETLISKWLERGFMNKLPLGEELNRICSKYGVSFHESALGGRGGRENEAILQARLLAFMKERRDSRTWIVALVSSIASVLSALAAWCAVLSIK